MNDKILDDYLRAYRSESDCEPSLQLRDRILVVPDEFSVTHNIFSSFMNNPWHIFDLMMPKVIGWTATACLGLYMGFSPLEQGDDSEYFAYDQTQLFLYEDLTGTEDD